MEAIQLHLQQVVPNRQYLLSSFIKGKWFGPVSRVTHQDFLEVIGYQHTEIINVLEVEVIMPGYNNSEIPALIRIMVTEQFLKMFPNCAFCAKRAILEHFHELLRNHTSD